MMQTAPSPDADFSLVKFGRYSTVRYGELYSIPCGLRLASGEFEPAAALLNFSIAGVFRAGEPLPLLATPTVLIYPVGRDSSTVDQTDDDTLAYELSRDGLDWGIVVARPLLDELARLHQFALPPIDASTQVRCHHCRRALPRAVAV